MPTKHQIRRVVQGVTSTPWMLSEEKMHEILELLQMRSEGHVLSDEEIEQRIGNSRSDRDDGIQIVNGVAVVPVIGTTAPRMNLMMRYSGGTSTQIVRSQLERLAADNGVKAIVMDIDSPGGTAIGNVELAEYVFSQRDSDTPIYASINGLGTSAGYQTAAAAKKVFASPSSNVGSVGVLLIHSESSKAAEEAGVKYTVIQAGEFKAVGNTVEPLSDKARSELQQRVDAYYAQFIGSVAKYRGVSVAEAQERFGNAKIHLAEAAASAGFIDGVATLQDVVSQVAGSVTTPSQSTSVPVQKMGENHMNSQIKSALHARGLLDSANASDEMAEVAVNAFCQLSGMERPTDDDGVLKLLTFAAEQQSTTNDSTQSTDTTQQPQLTQEDLDKAAKEERYRCEEIRSQAALIGLDGDAKVVARAIEESWTPEQASAEFIKQMASQREDVDLTAGESAVDKFTQDAYIALCGRMGIDREADGSYSNGMEPTQGSAACSRMKMVDIMKTSLMQANQKPSPLATDEDIAAQFLSMGGDISMAASNDPAYHGGGSFPNLLSALANKMLDRGMQIAETTYQTWTNRLPDIPDFKPATIVAAGEFNLLPLHPDGRPFEHSDMEEAVSWIEIESYGDEFVLTPKMLVNDNLDAFQQALRNKGIAHELTLNKLALDLLLSNPRTADGKALFDASHNNDIASGGGVDSAQLSAMRKLHRAQKGISGVQFLRYDARYVLTGPHWETMAQQTLLNTTYPQVEGEVNVFRGRYTPITEPMLQDAPDEKIWYTMVDPAMLRGLCHAFQTGYGRGGRRRSYFRQETQCRHFQIEGRFAVCAMHHQAIVRNNGS